MCFSGNSIPPHFLLFICLCLPTIVFGCLLCPLHVPARPKPLDQFRLPSIQKLVRTAETFELLCQNSSRWAKTIFWDGKPHENRFSDVSPACRSEVSHLFCSLSQLANSLRAECPGAEEEAECAQCRAQNAQIYSANKWVLTWVDSVGKMPSGISDGNYHWLGDYEQCHRLNELATF